MFLFKQLLNKRIQCNYNKIVLNSLNYVNYYSNKNDNKDDDDNEIYENDVNNNETVKAFDPILENEIKPSNHLIDVDNFKILGKYPPAIDWESRKEIILPFGDKEMKVELGKMSYLCDSSCLVTVGGTSVLVTVVKNFQSQMYGFIPLTVEYVEKGYSNNIIPGTKTNRREKFNDHEIIIGRMIDRSIRPLFRNGVTCATDVIAQVLSYDHINDPEVISINASSIALAISSIPWYRDVSKTPISAIRIGKINSNYIINPSKEELKDSSFDIMISSNVDKIFMIEASGNEIPERDFINAIEHSQIYTKELCEKFAQIDKDYGFITKFNGREAWPIDIADRNIHNKLKLELRKLLTPLAVELITNGKNVTKKQREIAQKTFYSKAFKISKPVAMDFFSDPQKLFGVNYPRTIEQICQNVISNVLKRVIHDSALGWHDDGKSLYVVKTDNKKRVDGRKPNELRPVSCDINVLPSNVHGSSLFTRGNTQTLCTVTIDSYENALSLTNNILLHDNRQQINEDDNIEQFMLHYDFPPYSIGKIGNVYEASSARRSIGHGMLAEKAIKPLLKKFLNETKYTLRITSEVTSSDGSSSMATVCGASLALMHAGIPIERHVAGLSIGFVEAPGEYETLVDLLGMEDYFGGMDFKIAGTKNGITAAQLDIKVPGISIDLIKRSCRMGLKARKIIIDIMESKINKPLKRHNTPKFYTIKFNKEADLIGRLIGRSGIHLQTLQDIDGLNTCKVMINNDDEAVEIFARSQQTLDNVLRKIKQIINEPEIAKINRNTNSIKFSSSS